MFLSAVITGAGSDQNCSSPIVLPSASGYLSSLVTMETGRGSPGCPWVVAAAAGQTVTMTLTDFSAPSNSSANLRSTAAGDVYSDAGSQLCVIYAEIKEKRGEGGPAGAQQQRVGLVCGGESRQKVVYASTVTTNSELLVIVYAATVVANPAYFLIKYEGSCCSLTLYSIVTYTSQGFIILARG